MFNSIWSDVKREVAQGNMVTRIIIVNIGVWIFLILAKITLNGFGYYEPLFHSLNIATDLDHSLLKPWSLFTYMFVHEGLGHIFFNMLIFYWFGRIIGDFIGDRRILPLYIMGGLAGAIVFFMSMFLLKPDQMIFCHGASASVMAFVFASATLSPDYEMRLILIGPVKIKFIAAALFLIDLATIANDVNTGGHFAHIGGAIMGSLYILTLRKGDDLATPFNNFFDWSKSLFSKPPPKPKKTTAKVRTLTPQKPRRSVFGEKPSPPKAYDGMGYQEKLDAILDKINDLGYEELSEEEKEFLVEASKK